MNEIILDVKNLSAGYETRQGIVKAVDNVSFTLRKGEFLGICGESGCGKSTLAYAIMNLFDDNGRIFDGEINFLGKNIASLSAHEMKGIRWANMSMVFQSAMNALNPVLRISDQLIDPIQAHDKSMSVKEARQRAKELLELVDIPADRLDAYPHQLSGGMKQRVMIAMALVLSPELVIMDEPTTALDVVVQRTIIEKIEDLRKLLDFAVIFITHDLSLLVEISDRLAVMYAGKMIEVGPADSIYRHSYHPYTEGLMNSFPPLLGELKEFGGIAGKPPNLLNPPTGCRFEPRCGKRMAECQESCPELKEMAPGHWVSCRLYDEEEGREA